MNMFTLFLPRVLVSLKCALKHATCRRGQCPALLGGQESCGSWSRVMAPQHRAWCDQKHRRGVLEGSKETALEDRQVPSLHPPLRPVM